MELKAGYKQTEVGAIPEDWEITTVGEAFEIHNTLRFPISNAVRETMPGPYPYYGPTSIQGYINEYRVEGEYALIGEDGDHFLKWQTQPMTLLVQGKFNVNNHAHLVRGTKNLTSWFYYYFSRRDLTPFLTRQGASRYKLTKKKLAALPCAIPAENAEQAAISEALRDADALIESLDQLIAKKRQIKQGAMQELLTGKRRLPGFSGEWEVRRLGELADMGSGGTPPSSNPSFYDGEIPWVAIADMTKGGKLISHTERNLSNEGFSNCAAQMFSAGTVLYAMYASLGECSIASVPLSSSQAILGIRVKEKLSNEFLYYYLQSIKPKVKTLGQQGTQANLNKGMVQDFSLQLPPVIEQTAIATILSDMDSELAALESRLAKARQIKQGMMQELLTGGIRLL